MLECHGEQRRSQGRIEVDHSRSAMCRILYFMNLLIDLLDVEFIKRGSHRELLFRRRLLLVPFARYRSSAVRDERDASRRGTSDGCWLRDRLTDCLADSLSVPSTDLARSNHQCHKEVIACSRMFEQLGVLLCEVMSTSTRSHVLERRRRPKSMFETSPGEYLASRSGRDVQAIGGGGGHVVRDSARAARE